MCEDAATALEWQVSHLAVLGKAAPVPNFVTKHLLLNSSQQQRKGFASIVKLPNNTEKNLVDEKN